MAAPADVPAATTQVLLIRAAAGPTYSRVVAPGHQPVRLLLRDDAQLLRHELRAEDDLLPSDLSTHDVRLDSDEPADFSVKTLRSEGLSVHALGSSELASHADLAHGELGAGELSSSEFKADIPSSPYKEPLSVQVIAEQTEAHDYSQLSPAPLSPRDDIPTSVHSMIDASDFRSLPQEPMYQNLSSLGGRMSPSPYSPSSSYATLTPLQPLPPISTVSDRFAYGQSGNVSGSFTVMHNNQGLSSMNLNSPYHYDKLSHMSMSPTHYSSNNGLMMHQQPSPLSPQNYSHNGMHSPQKSISPENYNSPYTREDLSRATLAQPQSPALSPSVSLHSPPSSTFNGYIATTTLTTSALTPSFNSINAGSLGPLSPHAVSPNSPSLHLQSPPSPAPQLRDPMHAMSAPSLQGGGHIQHTGQSLTTGHQVQCKSSSSSTASDSEELNTKELAQRISAELKRYSIPQAIFAQRVLCRSQGTLSDLLRNPKPWSKLKSGRETFRRMWKWLQEPEFQRMSSLRLAGGSRHDAWQERDKHTDRAQLGRRAHWHLQKERGTATYRATAGAQETAACLYRPAATNTAGYF
ncbi:hepatocyte nuclear factor 6-like isoform X6 [Pollicipes pollicipes]|uniref:hepatocyte nuclear factor 6-like isoform X6 n=1 Tax=Pollicipes pollicipes TaxID=41117 RepID=UPI0018856882|nr:hepatocyte nuclear factor 6-like isoform X6 [Pollicipes pollicipes]